MSQRACLDFYVNKRSEEVHGKMRIIIDYKSFNYSLADDKVPLSNRNALFSKLSKVRVFSKFDLKAKFWQLGIKSEDTHKTWILYSKSLLPIDGNAIWSDDGPLIVSKDNHKNLSSNNRVRINLY